MVGIPIQVKLSDKTIGHSYRKNLMTILESLNVVATYDYENDEWGEEGQLSLARGSADATVTKIPRSYWFNKFEFTRPKR